MTFTDIAPRTPAFPSKLPQVGTTIFTVMSALAAEHGAVNLGQGFPDFHCDPALIDAVDRAMRAGHNQYPLWQAFLRCAKPLLQKLKHFTLVSIAPTPKSPSQRVPLRRS